MRAYRAALLRFDDEGRPVYDEDGLLLVGPEGTVGAGGGSRTRVVRLPGPGLR